MLLQYSEKKPWKDVNVVLKLFPICGSDSTAGLRETQCSAHMTSCPSRQFAAALTTVPNTLLVVSEFAYLDFSVLNMPLGRLS